jgi:N-acetylmuramoyl-L-alanine amidase
MIVRCGPILTVLALIAASALVLRAVPQSTPASSSPTPAQNSQQPAGPRNAFSVVVLDPAHGGADQGARGSSNITESDIVLSFARALRIPLEAQGLRVILTRQGNEGPSFDDRSKIVNAQRGAIFITLHVSSTGPAGTVRVYSLPKPAAPVMTSANPELIRWDHAQDGFADPSRKLAELIQVQMVQRFPVSPQAPMAAAVRQLRTIAAPAIAIESSSVSVPDRAPMDQMAPLLADGVARAVAAFRLAYDTGVK